MIIAKFSKLTASEVAEHIDTSWDQWCDWLIEDPSEYTGQLEHGGWSPVRYDPPKRAKENVREVSALVLDYDKQAQWDAIVERWRAVQGVVYTTKSHTADSHRLRAVLPLARPVTAEEYPRIWEWASKQTACPVDQQCKDVSRFWYDPSKPTRGQWRARKLTGPALDPDQILALVATPKLRVVETPRALPDDERERRAVAYLAKIPGAVSGDAGHTQTFNAVAAMMFGFDLDESTTLRLITDHYNPRCDPPWSERELEHKIKSVASKCTRERGYLLQDRPRVSPTTPTAPQTYADAPDGVAWDAGLMRKKDGSVKRGYFNVELYVSGHPQYRGKWALDTMCNRIWFDGAPMPDTMVHQIRSEADQRLGFTPARDDVEAAAMAAASRRPFHPVARYLRSLDWDGTPRLASMAAEYLGSSSAIHAEMVRRWMIGAAKRALEPGCKLDTALMLVGQQGARKSTFFATLGGQWHADTYVDITNKDSYVQIHSAWIYELSELENVVSGRAESRLKAWLTSTHDMYRAPYQRVAESKPRGVVICGTTNRAQFLTDETGSRRFWIVPVNGLIDTDRLAVARDQLWAEAVAAAEAGERWWLDAETERLRAMATEDFHESDSWEQPIAEWLATPLITEVTTTELLRDALKLDVGKHGRFEQIRCGRVLGALGWARERRGNGDRTWVYRRPNVPKASH